MPRRLQRCSNINNFPIMTMIPDAFILQLRCMILRTVSPHSLLLLQRLPNSSQLLLHLPNSSQLLPQSSLLLPRLPKSSQPCIAMLQPAAAMPTQFHPAVATLQPATAKLSRQHFIVERLIYVYTPLRCSRSINCTAVVSLSACILASTTHRISGVILLGLPDPLMQIPYSLQLWSDSQICGN